MTAPWSGEVPSKSASWTSQPASTSKTEMGKCFPATHHEMRGGDRDMNVPTQHCVVQRRAVVLTQQVLVSPSTKQELDHLLESLPGGVVEGAAVEAGGGDLVQGSSGPDKELTAGQMTCRQTNISSRLYTEGKWKYPLAVLRVCLCSSRGREV